MCGMTITHATSDGDPSHPHTLASPRGGLILKEPFHVLTLLVIGVEARKSHFFVRFNRDNALIDQPEIFDTIEQQATSGSGIALSDQEVVELGKKKPPLNTVCTLISI